MYEDRLKLLVDGNGVVLVDGNGLLGGLGAPVGSCSSGVAVSSSLRRNGSVFEMLK